MYIYRANVYKLGNDEVIDTVHCIAFSEFQASHFFNEFAMSGRYSHPIEIDGVSKVREIHHIINPEFMIDILEEMEDEIDVPHSHGKYDGSLPLKVAENMTDEETMKLNCGDCSENIRVPINMLFPYVTCPNCGLEMMRKDIHNAGGIYYYHKPNDNKDNKK